MRLFPQAWSYRTVAAAFAAVAGIGICIFQRHVHIVLSQPDTYSSPLHHRCGLLMLGCMFWAAIEMVLAPVLDANC